MFDGFLTLPVLAVGAFFAVSYFVNPETIIIEEISVPLYLEYRGFNNEVATGLLTEEVAKIAHAATTNRGTMRSEEHTSEHQSLLRDSYGVFSLKKNNLDMSK